MPSFLKALRYPLPGAVMVAMDVNHDGLPDLVTANGVVGGVSLLLGNGDRTFILGGHFGQFSPLIRVTSSSLPTSTATDGPIS